MAKKMFEFLQEREFNGDKTYKSIKYECSPDEASWIVTNSEGKIRVMEENTTLSSPESTSTTVTSGLPIQSISMAHNDGVYKSFGYKTGAAWIFKSTVSAIELQNQFKTHKPFVAGYATEKPDRVIPNVSHMGNL